MSDWHFYSKQLGKEGQIKPVVSTKKEVKIVEYNEIEMTNREKE